MRVDVFMLSTFHERERDVLRCMYTGIKNDLWPDELCQEDQDMMRRMNKKNKLGTGVNLSYDERIKPRHDLGVIFGSWKKRENDHHKVRTQVANIDKPFLCIETQLLGRVMFQESEYHRVGVNGFLNEDAVFGLEQKYSDDRFKKLNLEYNGWKKSRGDKIVVALQLPGDASLRGMDINDWAIWTLERIRKESDRPIEIRLHPGVSQKGVDAHLKLMQYQSFHNIPDVSFVKGNELPWEEHILDAHCVVAYTSGLSIDAVRNGIPVVACDPGNFAWGISSKNAHQVENPFMASEDNIQSWLNSLAYCQWSKAEMESGEAWAHLKPVVQKMIEDEKIENEGS
jgi:hypothetical protein